MFSISPYFYQGLSVNFLPRHSKHIIKIFFFTLFLFYLVFSLFYYLARQTPLTGLFISSPFLFFLLTVLPCCFTKKNWFPVLNMFPMSPTILFCLSPSYNPYALLASGISFMQPQVSLSHSSSSLSSDVSLSTFLSHTDRWWQLSRRTISLSLRIQSKMNSFFPYA